MKVTEIGMTISKHLMPLRGLEVVVKRNFSALFMSQHVGDGEAEVEGRKVKYDLGTTGGLGGASMMLTVRVEGISGWIGYDLDMRPLLEPLVADGVRILLAKEATGMFPDDAQEVSE